MTIINSFMLIGHFMHAKDIFATNVDAVLTQSNTTMKELQTLGNELGDKIDYTYLMKVRKGTTNPSMEKCEQIVRMLKSLPGYNWIELWQFLIPGYFAQHSENILNKENFSQGYFDNFVKEFIVTASRLQIVSLSETQFDQLTELSKYIYQKQHGLPVVEPEKVEIKVEPNKRKVVMDI